MDFSNPVVSGLIGGVVTLGLMYLAGRMRPVVSDENGWLVLRPGWLLNGLFVSCVAFCALLIFALIDGADRPDWREQITPLICMILGFGAGAVYVAWAAYSRVVRWNAERIVVDRRFGDNTEHPWPTVRRVTTNSMSGEYVLTFQDGGKLRIPTMMKGAKQFARELQERGFR